MVGLQLIKKRSNMSTVKSLMLTFGLRDLVRAGILHFSPMPRPLLGWYLWMTTPFKGKILVWIYGWMFSPQASSHYIFSPLRLPKLCHD